MSAPAPAAPSIPRTVILASGNGSNLQAILDARTAGQLPIDLVGVMSDRPGSGALERAARTGVPAVTVTWNPGRPEEFHATLGERLEVLQPDLIVLAGFMRILPTTLVARWQGRLLNVHPSLLPAYPGLHTHRRVLAAGEQTHGATVHFVIPELDAGPPIIQFRLKVRAADDEHSLHRRVQVGEHVIYPRAVAWFAAGQLTLRDGSTWLEGQRLAVPVCVDEADLP